MDEKIIDDDNENNKSHFLEISNDEPEENIFIFKNQEERNINDDEIKKSNKYNNYNRKLNFQFYSYIFISIIYLIISLFSYSYLNIIHIFLSFFLISILMNVNSKQLFMFTKTIIKITFLLQFIYILIKGFLFSIYKIFGNEILPYKIYFEIFNIKFENIKFSLFDMGIILFEFFLLFIFYSINNFNDSNWENFSAKSLKFIKSWKGNENSLLSFGLYFMCLGTIVKSTIINAFLLFLILIDFSSVLFNLRLNHWTRKKIAFFLKYFIPFYFIINYIFNCPCFNIFLQKLFIKEKGNKSKEQLLKQFYEDYGIIELYKKSTNALEDFYFENYIILNIVSFIFFYFSYCSLFLFAKLKSRKIYDKNDIENHLTTELIDSYDSMNESIDVAQGIIRFYTESKHLSLYNKIKLYIIKYCFTPEFFLHLCRIGIIIWVNLYLTYANVILIIWIFLSIYMENMNFFLNITKFTIFPLLLLVFVVGYVYNIKKFESLKQYKLFGLDNYEGVYLFLHMGIKITIITFFYIYIYIQMKYFKFYDLHKQDIERKKKLKEKEIKELIKTHFKGNYILQGIEIIFKIVSITNSILVTVFFYLSICQNINIFNEIVLLFIISIYVFSKNIDEYYFGFLVFLNIFFTLKYIVYFIYPKNEINDNNSNIYNLLSLLFFDNLKNIHYSWIAFYFLYIEYCNSTNIIFQKCKSKTFSIFQLIEQNQKIGNSIKFFLITIFDFIFGVYIWLIIPCFIVCLQLKDNNLLFLFQLFITFIIYYKYIKIAGNKYQNNENIFIYVWFLILSSIINFVIIYIVQFLNKRPLSFWNALNSPQSRRNLELIGLFLFDADYTKSLLPYMIMFIISIALYAEIDRQLKLNSSDKKFNSQIFSDGSEDYHKTYLLNDDDLQAYSKKIYYVLYYILHYYWIIVFLVVAILSIYWMLSISMLIEILIFSFYIMKSFKNYYSNIIEIPKNEKENFQLYETQKKNHFQTTHSLQKEYFNLVWQLNLTLISLCYSVSIVFKFLEKEKDTNKMKLVNSIIYLLGVYSSNENNQKSFITYSFGYFLIIFLFSVRAYFFSKFEQIKVNLENAELRKKNLPKRKRGGSFGKRTSKFSLEKPEDEDLNLINSEKYLKNDSNNNLYNHNNNSNNINDNSFYIVEFNEDIENNNDILNFDENKKDNNFDIIHENIIPKFRHLYGSFKSKDDSQIKYLRNKIVAYSISFQKAIKSFLEVFIIILILLAAIIKLNIISYIFLFIVIWSYKIKGINTKTMFYISSIVLILFNLQYLIFVSNISYITNPFSNNEKLIDIFNIFHIPWYVETLGTKWGFFFSCGVYQYQIRTLWIDVIILIVLYFYLEFFSFSIYVVQLNENIKINKLYKKYSEKFSSLRFLTRQKYENFIYNMKFSYDLDLKLIYSKDNSESIINEEKENKKSLNHIKNNKNKVVKKFQKLRNYLFLVLHQFVLVYILIFSSLNRGLISIGYISFSIYYIYNICHFLSAKKWGLKNGIIGFMKPYLFFDLMIQFIFQIPLDTFKTNSDTFQEFMNILGYGRLIDFNSKTNFINKNQLIATMAKIFCYFLLLLQEVVYSSYEFKKYILKYHYEYLNQSYIIGKLHSFLFNNHRIRLMNDRLDEGIKIEETLDSLKEMIENWNNKIQINYSDEYNSNIKIKKRNNEITLGKLVRKHWLVKLALRIHYGSRYINSNRINNKEEILKILQGDDLTYSELEEIIKKFEKENADKFDLYKNNIKEIDDVKENLKQKEEQLNLIQIDLKNENKKNELYQSNISFDSNKEEEEKKLEEEEIKLKEEENQLKKLLTKQINISKEIDSDIFFPSAEYYEKKHKIRNLFFKNYFSKGKLFIYLFQSIYNYIIENFEYTCYFFMVIDNFAYGSLISIFWTVLVFVFGIIQYPRPKKGFWKFCLFLSSTVIFIKFVIQLNFVNIILKQDSNYPKLKKFFANLENKDSILSRFGFKRYKENEFMRLFKYLIFDFLVLTVLLINQFLLIKKGLWYEIENDYETIEEANKRIQFYKSKKAKEKFRLIPKILNYNQIQSIFGDPVNYETNGLYKKIKSFINNNIYYIRNEKPGKDFYFLYTIFQILIIIYIILFYTRMEQDKLLLNGDSLQVKQFSKNMLIFLFIHLFFCVFDRYIYLQNSRKIKKIEFKIYNKETGEDVTKILTQQNKKFRNYDGAFEELKNSTQYELISYQNEGIQYSIIYKFVLQIFSVIFIHIFIFWYLPTIGSNTNIMISLKNVSFVNELFTNNYILIFYILYCFYFTFSGLQIKYGLAGMRKLSSLMAGSSMTYYLIFKTFKVIPFLFELKNFIDWSFTPTALEIWQWLKFEEINAMLFISKCYNKSYMGRRIGTKRTLFLKITMGWSLLISVLFFIFSPLLLFSSLNPSTQLNSIIGTYMKVQFYFNNSIQSGNLTLLESSTSQIKAFDSNLYKNLTTSNKTDPELKMYLGYYKDKQIQNVTIRGYGDFNWDISPQSYQSLIKNIKDNSYSFFLRLTYSFTRKYGKSDESLYKYEEYNLTQEQLKNLFISDNISNLKSKNIFLNNSFSKFIRVPSEQRPITLIPQKQSINLGLIVDKEYRFWYIKSLNNKNNSNIEGIDITTFSDEFSSLTFGYSVLTFYMAFIVVGGNYLRSIFLGSAELVMFYEMVLPNKLLNVCEGIRIARIKKDYLKEEQLYYLLIDLMRSPEMIKSITKSSLIFIQDNNIIKNEEIKKKIESIAIIDDFNSKNRKSFNRE